MAVLTRGADALPGSALDFRTGDWRDQRPIHRHRPAPCHHACPAGEDPQAYIARLDEGNPRAAWEALIAANPLPAITGRVCHHPCEDDCNRGQFDQAIAIHEIERFLGDAAIREDWPYPVPELADDAPEVAVVGAGPAGLSAAYHLRRLGHRVALYDRYGEAGGMLALAIPGYRLPRAVREAEIDRLLATGIDFHRHQVLGRDVYLDDLGRRHGAVFLAPGCHRPREWSVDGARPDDARDGLGLLKEWLNVGVTPAPGKRVVVQGGGNTGVDIARVLRFSGAGEVHLVTASALPDDESAPPEDRMSAIPREVAQARDEGVIIHPHHTLTRLILREGRVVGVEIAALRKLDGDDGHRRRVAFEGTETVIAADEVVPAIGEIVDPLGIEALIGRERYLRADAWGRLAEALGVFAGGDALGQAGTVTAAIGDGHRAAEAIARHIRHEPESVLGGGEPVAFDDLNRHYFDRAPRQKATVLPVAERDGTTEIERGLGHERVAAEARRCFSCGDCLACDNCWTLCPDLAVLKTRAATADGGSYVFDYDYCKGCGLCAEECPSGYIAMIEEPTAT